MQRAFETAFDPRPYYCLKLRLLPLSLGHVFNLAAIRSPFIEGGKTELSDLSDAVLICSQPWQDTRKPVSKWGFDLFVKFWAWRCRRLSLAIEIQHFQKYFAEATDFPIAKGASDHREFGSPWWVRLLARSIAELHLPELVAMAYPVNKLACLLAAKSEAHGEVKLWSENDDAFEAFCNRMDKDSGLQFPPPANRN